MPEQPLLVLIVAGNWWPAAARLASALIAHGCAVRAVCPRGHPLRYVEGIRGVYLLRGLASRASLLGAIRDCEPGLIIPCDDGSVTQLHELHGLHPDLRPLIERSLGDPRGYQVLESRDQLLQKAQQLGIRTAEAQRVRTAAEARVCYDRFGPTALLKLDVTCGGAGVQIVQSRAHAAAAFRRMRRAGGLGRSLKRLCVNSDPLALWSWRRRERTAVSMQRFIVGTPANIMLACWQGRVIAEVCVRAVASQGPTGAALVVQLIEHAECSHAARLLAAHLGMSGFFGLDFILDERTDTAHLIEMNPRCTQLGHLQIPRGDLAGALCAAVRGVSRAVARQPITADLIAFFPQARLWGVSSALLERAHHDVPSDQKPLLEILQQQSWPERRWLARAYHLLRRPMPMRAVEVSAARLEEPRRVAGRSAGYGRASGGE